MVNRALGRLGGCPLTQVQVLLDLPAFITMLPRLLRLVIHFAEGVFGIADGFTDDFQRFGHSLVFWFDFGLARRESYSRPCLGGPLMLDDWHRLLQAIQLYDKFAGIPLKVFQRFT